MKHPENKTRDVKPKIVPNKAVEGKKEQKKTVPSIKETIQKFRAESPSKEPKIRKPKESKGDLSQVSKPSKEDIRKQKLLSVIKNPEPTPRKSKGEGKASQQEVAKGNQDNPDNKKFNIFDAYKEKGKESLTNKLDKTQPDSATDKSLINKVQKKQKDFDKEVSSTKETKDSNNPGEKESKTLESTKEDVKENAQKSSTVEIKSISQQEESKQEQPQEVKKTEYSETPIQPSSERENRVLSENKQYLQPENIETNAILQNVEKSSTGKELSGIEKELNDFFRGDQFIVSKSFNESINPELRNNLVNSNYLSTCELNENLSGKITTNDNYLLKMSDVETKYYNQLKELRNKISPIDENTIMQKVILPEVFVDYVKSERPKDVVTGCASKAEDFSPYCNNIHDAYKNARLDYGGSNFEDLCVNNSDMYVMRFRTTEFPTNDDYPKVVASEPWNKPPCSSTGFTASNKYLIPEYTYGLGKQIIDGAIFKIDIDGKEYLAAYWDNGRFNLVE